MGGGAYRRVGEGQLRSALRGGEGWKGLIFRHRDGFDLCRA